MVNQAFSSFIPARTIALIGMPASGKSSVGTGVATRLRLPFHDSDAVIEKETGVSVAEYFSRFGEADFRAREEQTIARLLAGGICVLSLGGGAFMSEATRKLLRRRAVTVWLKADVEILLERAERHKHSRPLLAGAMRARMEALLSARAPVYAEADVTVESDRRALDTAIARVADALARCQRVAEVPS